MKLAVISHTQHYYNTAGKLVGWGPTVTELNHLLGIFEEIYHIAVLIDEPAPKSAISYDSDNIHFVPLKMTGGHSLKDKTDILLQIPDVLKKVHKTLQEVDYFQLRTPTGMGVYLIPYLTWYVKNKGWFKYAGNWDQKNAPLGFALQRWMLKKQKRTVTINGKWETQPKHCITFENPCLSSLNRAEGKELIEKKAFERPYSFCFAGRLEDQKGVGRILEAFSQLKHTNSVKEVHFIGDGPKMNSYKAMAEKMEIKAIFHGFISFYDVVEIYKKAHFFLLPSSASEGFPKVIAEAMNFGCIPIVSDVSSIGQYIKQNINGYIVEPNDSLTLAGILNKILESETNGFNKMMRSNHSLAKLFTYERYVERIKNEIVN